MKTTRNVLKAVALAVLACSASLASAATTTQPVTVSATVLGVCKFSTGATIALTFDNIDPSGADAATKQVNLPIRCTAGMTPAQATVTTGGSTLSRTGGGGSMTYSLTLSTTPTGAGFAASPTNIVATGTIAAAAYQPAPAGTYTDAVVVSLDY